MLGDIVHNETVVDDLNKRGSKVVESLNDIPEDKLCYFVPMAPIQKHGRKRKKEVKYH